MHEPRVADAVTASPHGCIIALTLHPGRTTTRFPDGYDPWRRRLTASVAAQPKDGAANHALVEAAARFFERPATSVRIIDGATTRQKRLLVTDLEPQTAVRLLADALAKEPP